MKKISFIIGAAILAVSVFTGCQKKSTIKFYQHNVSGFRS